MFNNIAILGFALPCPKKNQEIAIEAGKKIASLGFGIITGNIVGTTEYVFKGAKSADGRTYSIIEQQIDNYKTNYSERKNCDILYIVNEKKLKHKMLSDLCLGALVIGGGNGTLDVMKKFIEKNKPVIAIQGTGGITQSDLQYLFPENQVIMCEDVHTAIFRNIRFWKN